MKFKRSISAFLLLTAMFAGGIFFAHPTIAATNAASANLQTFAETAGFATTATIPIIITRLIRTFLSFLGIIAVLIVLYGGFLYMTAGGNDDRVKKAKKVLLNAIIGIVLILSAFGIVQFILGKLGDVTGSGGSNVKSVCVKCNNYVSSHPSFTVSMNSSCSGSDGALKNYKPQLVFSQPISLAVTSRIRVTKDSESDPTKQEVRGTFELLNAKTAVFTPADTCTEDTSLHCFDSGTAYTVTVASSLESISGDKLSCTTANPCVNHFITGNKIDKAPPTVTIGFPGGTATNPGSVYLGTPTGLQAIAFDDSGASTVNFYVSNTFISSVVKTPGASVNPLYTDYFTTDWNTSTFQPHRTYRISADAMDCAGNVSRRSPDSLVYLYPANCNTASSSTTSGGNGAVCGGDKTSPTYCGACNKSECKVNADCASNFCVNGYCVSVPVIESVSPDNGAVNNLVTISGKGFGSVPGTVDFLGVRGKTKTTAAYSCNGTTKWSDTEIVVQIPDGAVDGPLQVNTPAIPAVLATPSIGSTPAVIATPAVDAHSDSTIDATGPYLAAFDVNHIQRPGLCSLTPSTKEINTPIALNGLSLGASQGSSTVYFNNFVAPSYPGTWTNTLAHATVPNLEASSAAGVYATQVFTGDYLCLDKNQVKIDGRYCQIDSDCDVSNGESCGKSWCSENLKYCSLTTPCDKATEGVCTDVRVGSNAVHFSATVPSNAVKPVISYIDSGWKACSDGPKKDQHCSKDSECTDVSGATCARIQNYQICSSARTASGAYVTCTQDSDCKPYNATDTCGPSSASVCSSGAHKDQYCRNVADCDVAAAAGTVCAEQKTFGPPGQYITIYGSGFGTSGSVQFVQQGGGGYSADGDTNFPAACSASYWSDTAITVKVPSKFVADIGPISFGAYNLSVSSHTASSNATPFTIVTGKPSPGICKIVDAQNKKELTSGPVGTALDFIGEYFGDTKGSVTFTSNTSATPSTWTSIVSSSDPTSVAGFVLVPNASKTGPVFVTDGSSNHSNSLNFKVANCQTDKVCLSKTDICCGDGTCVPSGTTCPDFKAVTQFAYKISTNAVPVAPRVVINCTDMNQEHPSPAPSFLLGSVPANICVDSQVRASFTVPMDVNTLKDPNVIVEKCPASHTVLTVDTTTNKTSYTCSNTGSAPSWQKMTGHFSSSTKGFSWIPMTGTASTKVCASSTGTLTDPNDNSIYHDATGSVLPCETDDVCKAAKASNSCVTLTPATSMGTRLEPHTLYQVTIKGKSSKDQAVGVKSCADSPSCSLSIAMQQDFSWLFYTAPTDQPCKVGSVAVSPVDYTSSKIDELIPYLSIPLSAADICVPLSCSNKSFSWSTTNDLSAYVGAAIFPFDLNPLHPAAGNECNAIVQTKTPTPAGHKAKIDAKLTYPISSPPIIGEGTLAIKPAVPSVIDYFPRCSIACLNTYPWIQFNVDMDSLGFKATTPVASTSDSVKLIKCQNSLCSDTLETASDLVPISVVYNKITAKAGDTFIAHLSSTATLVPNTWYRIVLSSLKSKDQVALQSNYGKSDNGFYPGAFSWKFKTQVANSLCAIDHIEISPKVSTLSFVGEKQSLYAIGKSAPDECSSSGQDLQGAKQWTAWTATDVNPSKGAAGYKTGGATSSNGITNLDEVTAFMLNSGKIYTYTVPSFCSGSCLNLGSPIKSGQAVCGNGKLEPGEQCDDGNKVNGTCSVSSIACSKDTDCTGKGETCKLDGCSTSCLLEGISPTCGNGVLDPGEQCDDHNTKDGDGCSSNCLNEGSANMPGAVCGDGKLDHVDSSPSGVIAGGEDCDTGGLCGDGITACTVGSGIACDDGSICAPRTDLGCTANCKNTGSISIAYGASFCGDGVKNPGEDCDVGINNGKSGSGCTDTCKHTGTLPVISGGTCGNGKLDSGEDCDNGVNNGKADNECTANCLFAGSSSSYSSPSFCGEGAVTTGEECDATINSDVNYGTGLTIGSFGVAQIAPGARFEVETDKSKSTYGYAISNVTVTVPGAKKAGSATVQLLCSCTDDASCNTSGGTAYGCGAQNCCYERPKIQAMAPAQNFTAGIIPAVGYCRNTAISITFSDHMDSGTFSALTDYHDTNGAVVSCQNDDVCKSINQTYSCQNKKCSMGVVPHVQLELVKADGTPVTEAACKGAYPDLTFGFNSKGGNILVRAFNWLKTVVFGFFGHSAMAAPGYTNCIAPVSFDIVPADIKASGDGDQVFLRYHSMLAANSYYKLHVKTGVAGVLSTSGVDVCEGTGCSATEKTQVFYVGSDVCKLDSVNTTDHGIIPTPPVTQSKSVGMYSAINETHEFTVEPQTIRDITGPETISPVTGVYDWTWNWSSTFSDTDAAKNILTKKSVDPVTNMTATFNAVGKNGEEDVLGVAKIQNIDSSYNLNQKKDDEVTGSVHEIAFLCSNPWPSVNADISDPAYVAEAATGIYSFPFIETSKNTNFSFYYCRDSKDPAHPLPYLTKTDSTDFDPSASAEHILKELVFNVAGSKDAIGVRVLQNPDYLSPMAWFNAQHFNASASPTTLDGYQAVQAGNTIYVAGANVSSNLIYSNIYAISYNADAGPDAKTIFASVLKNMHLNAGLDLNGVPVVSNLRLCKNASGDLIKNADQYVSCSWDGDCANVKDSCLSSGNCSVANANGSLNTCKSDADCKQSIAGTSGAVCDADKSKLIRDTKRLEDVTDMIATFNRYANSHSHCSVSVTQSCVTNAECSGSETCVPSFPTVLKGTFVPSMTNSLWPSWNSALANALGASLPTDPINQFWQPCKPSTDPNAPGYDAKASGFDQSSCFNGQTNQFFCPANSHLYGYQTVGGGDVVLSAGLEYWNRSWSDPIGANHITVQMLYGKTPAQPALQSGFTLTSNFCNGSTSFGDSASCGDGVIGKHLVCTAGAVSTLGNTCSVATVAADCGVGGKCESEPEVCDKGDMNPVMQSCSVNICTKGDSSKISQVCTTNASCDTTSGTGKCTNKTCSAGDKTKLGHNCAADVDCETGGGSCDATAGKINAPCILQGPKACTAYNSSGAGSACVPFVCGNGVVDTGEQCDDGSLNGTYGHCGNNCQLATGANGFFCGDGKLGGPEQCDCGNGTADANAAASLPPGRCAVDANGSIIPNGQYSQSGGNCTFDCKLPGPSCGDGIVNGAEECDGGKDALGKMKPLTVTYSGKVCFNNWSIQCSSDADCSGGVGTCGVYEAADCSQLTYCNHASDAGKACKTDNDCQSKSCDGVTKICLDSTDTDHVCEQKSGSIYTDFIAKTLGSSVCQVGCKPVPRERVRTCKTDNSCKWDDTGTLNGINWSPCQEIGTPICGDGIVNGSEECDNGSQNSDNAACTSSCKLNVCGDGHVNVGVESCDAGINNKTSCSAAYGGTCSFCTANTCKYKTQSGGKCGDGVINGSEVCDGSALPYSCIKVDTTVGTGTIDVQGRCSKNDEGKVGQSSNKVCSISGKKCNNDHNTCTLPGETCGTTPVKFTDCADGYTCRFVGACNGGDMHNDNGVACTVSGSVLWGNDDISKNIKWCDHQTSTGKPGGLDIGSGNCAPPVCSNTCTSSCPVSYQNIPVEIKGGLIGSQYSDSYTFTPSKDGNLSPTQATISIPACTVGLKLNGTLLNANPSTDTATAVNVLFSTPVVTKLPTTVKALDVVLLVDVSGAMTDPYPGVGLGTYFDQEKTYLRNLLVNLHAKTAGSGLAVRVSLQTTYFDGTNFVTKNLVDKTSTPSFMALSDGTNYQNLLSTVDSLTPVSLSTPEFLTGLGIARNLLYTSKATKSVVLFSTASSVGESINAAGYNVNCDTDPTSVNNCLQAIKVQADSMQTSSQSVYAVGFLNSTYGSMMHMTTEPTCLEAGDQTILCPSNQYLVKADKTEESGTDSVPLPIALTTALTNTLLTNGSIPLNASGSTAPSSGTGPMVKLDVLQDLSLPLTFICTGQPFILPITIDPATATPTASSAITVKDLNFTYCPAKP